MALPSATARAGASFLGAAGTSAGAAVMGDDSAASLLGAADGDA
jgi:cyanophycinase-like exopeptidase